MAMTAAGGHYELVVIGGGRVGRAVAEMCSLHMKHGKHLPAPHSSPNTAASVLRPSLSPPSDLIIRRGQHAAPDRKGPIFVATQNHDLPNVICQTPESRRRDLVFLQNGYFAPVLEEHDLKADSITQVLLYMSASDEGDVVDGKLSTACGRWAEASAAVLGTGGVACRTIGIDAYHFCQSKKLLWASIFWLLSHGLGGITVGEVAKKHKAEVRSLVEELLPIAMDLFQPLNASCKDHGSGMQSQGYGSIDMMHSISDSVMAEVTQELCAYSNSIAAAVPSKDMAIKEFMWRNGALVPPGGPTPVHAVWLRRAGYPLEV